jgi:5-methylcytosine-specific restriction endonuclease McrA
MSGVDNGKEYCRPPPYWYIEPAFSRIQKGLCPVCETPNTEWKRKRSNALCCSPDCTEIFHEKYVMSWGKIRWMCFERDNFTCVKCGKAFNDKMAYYDGVLNADHIIPVAEGGETTLDNLQTLCKECHDEKTLLDVRRIRESKVADPAQKPLSVWAN